MKRSARRLITYWNLQKYFNVAVTEANKTVELCLDFLTLLTVFLGLVYIVYPPRFAIIHS